MSLLSLLPSWPVAKAYRLTCPALASVVLGSLTPVYAQVNIVPDSTLGAEASVLQTLDPFTQEIVGGATRGTNLFHSFLEFNVAAGQAVFFNPDAAVETVLSRVTGANPSNIFGTLGVQGGANLWLVNPNGIVFGENASLDISGSFFATTAAAIPLGEAGVFSAVEPESSALLSVSPDVSFLNFLTELSGNIVNSAVLDVDSAQSLVLAGNAVTSEGRLAAPGGSVEVMAVGDVTLREVSTAVVDPPTTDGGAISISSISGDVTIGTLLSYSSSAIADAGTGGAINVTSTSGDIILDDSFLASFSYSFGGNAGPGGAIDIVTTSGRVTLTNTFLSTVSGAYAGDAGNGGAISISSVSGDIILSNDTLGPGNFGSGSLNSTSGSLMGDSGNGGAITLASASGSVSLNNVYGNLNTFSQLGDNGEAGALTIASTTGTLTLQNSGFISNSVSFAGGPGEAGTITLSSTSGNINLVNAGLSSTFTSPLAPLGPAAPGDGGTIAISSRSGNISLYNSDLFTTSNANAGDAGDGGDITLTSTSGNITVLQGDFQAGSLSGPGNAGQGGNLTIASDAGTIIAEQSNFGTGSTSFSGDASNAGDIAFTSVSGDITTTDSFLRAYSLSTSVTDLPAGNAGAGGAIVLSAGNGQLQGDGTQLTTVATAEDGGTTGRGGNVTLEANTISGFEVLTVSGAGDSGNVTIRGFNEALVLTDLRLTTTGQVQIANPLFPTLLPITLDVGTVGQSGNTTIASAGDISFDNVEVQSDANGQEAAGNVTITSPGLVTFNNSRISSNANSAGDAGLITLNARQVNLGNGGRIFAETSGTGSGGDIFINATDRVFLGEGVQEFEPVISVEASGAGRPGNITITTPTFVLSETARVTATARATATNLEGGGSIRLNADVLDLQGTVGIFAETQGQAPGGVLTLQPYQDNPALALALAPGALISAATSGTGTGGGIVVSAPEAIRISGPGRLQVETSGTGRGGDIALMTQRLSLSDGVTLSASTTGPGSAGDIAIAVTDTVEIDNSTVQSSTGPESTGRGGSLQLTAADTTLRNGGQLSVNSAGQGRGGDVTVTGNRLTLETTSGITALTAASDGGDLTFSLEDALVLRNDSLISTEAGTVGAGGNGGGITIDSDFVIASADENSDIIANAFNGAGGQITITATSVLGLTERRGFTTGQLRANRSSDISASSQFGQPGTITLNTILADPTQGLSELSENFINSETIIASSCIAGRAAGEGSFVVAGLEGQPQQPSDVRATFATGTVRAVPEAIAPGATPRAWHQGDAVAEPDGVYQLTDGRLILSHRCDAWGLSSSSARKLLE